MIETKLKPEVLRAHFRDYFPSLKQYARWYLAMFGMDENYTQRHLAYICPICLENGILLNDQGLSMHFEFSPDHFPPQSVGGSQSVLVCNSCNSGAGRDYDFSLKQHVQDLAFNKRIPEAKKPLIKSKITERGKEIKGKYPALMRIDEKGDVEISLKPKTNFHAPFLDSFIDRSKKHTDYKIDLTIPSTDMSKVARAAVKAAYLHCFQLWGYEFPFSFTGMKLREVMSGKMSYPINCPAFYLGELLNQDKTLRLPAGVCYLREPFNWRSFIINMTIRDTETPFAEIVSVLIPGPAEEHWNSLSAIQQELSSRPEKPIVINHVTEFAKANTDNGYTKASQLLYV